ncbi:MAG: hypothetical protein IRY83_14900 [Chloroflexi bacterium]|nr:hypothetical protein [Chloroflexota bacterium]
MKIRDWTKLATILIVAGGALWLGDAGQLDSQAVVALLGACLGYVFGNSHAVMEARSGQSQAGAPESSP